MNKKLDKLLKTHQKLVHSENQKVVSHVQREKDDWFVNTLMVESYDVPFKFQRKKKYKSLVDARVNLTYYPETETVASFDVEIMKVVRIKIA